jgi:hypothetical protein
LLIISSLLAVAAVAVTLAVAVVLVDYVQLLILLVVADHLKQL